MDPFSRLGGGGGGARGLAAEHLLSWAREL